LGARKERFGRLNVLLVLIGCCKSILKFFKDCQVYGFIGHRPQILELVGPEIFSDGNKVPIPCKISNLVSFNKNDGSLNIKHTKDTGTDAIEKLYLRLTNFY
jgi:hypothetical protein